MSQKLVTRFKRIDDLISRKATGTPSQLSAKLDISKSTLYEFINLMKDSGAPIYYNKQRNSYCYKSNGRFSVSFVLD